MSVMEAKIEVRTEKVADGTGVVARMLIDNQVRHNIINTPLLGQMSKVLAELASNPDVRVLIVTGAGDKAFIGGADISEMAKLDVEGARSFITRIHLVCKALREFPVPVVARVCGYCLGAGLEIAASCDLRIAGDTAKFGMPEVRMGVPSVIEAAVLPRLIGWGRTRELLYTGDNMNAYDALSAGLVERVSPQAKLEETVNEVIHGILQAAPGALRLQKALIRQWANLSENEAIELGIEYFAKAYESGEPQECMNRFLDRLRQRKQDNAGTRF